MLIDIGVNLSNDRFSGDVKNVLTSSWENGIRKLVLTGTSLQESKAVLDLLKKHERYFPEMLYATAGIHPHNAAEFCSTSIQSLRSLTANRGVVAIGETGLDFYRNLSSPKDQIKSFEAHLELARETGLPLFMHEREASKQQISLLKTYRSNFTKGVIHCFTGNRRTLYQYLDMDLYIGITGWICDERRGLELQEIVADIPLHRLMVETDSPYLLPRNMAFPPKSRRNEPAFLPWVISGIANCRPESETEISEQTSNTAIEFFGL